MPTAAQILRFLRKHGYRQKRQTGSHLILEHADRRMLVLPQQRGDIPRGLFLRILFASLKTQDLPRKTSSKSRTAFLTDRGLTGFLKGKRNGFGINGAGSGNGPPALTALADVGAHGLNDTGLGFFNGFAQTVHPREIFTVGIILPALPLNGNGVSVQFHGPILTCAEYIENGPSHHGILKSHSG